SVEVTGHESDRVPGEWDRVAVLKPSDAVAQQGRHVVRPVVGDCQVEMSVAAEVPRHQRDGRDPGGELACLIESASAVAPEDYHLAVAVRGGTGDILEGDSQIEVAVLVEVADGQC